jgi:L-lactate dehydrogenase complex protein LldE
MSSKLKVDLFVPCFMDQVFPQTAMNMVKILEKLGCEVHYNPEQTCCGQPAYNAGFFQEAQEVALKFIKDFSHPTARYVVCPSASCTGMVRNSYNDLLENTSNHLELKQIQKNIFELSEFITQVLMIEKVEGAHFPHKVTYHDSCSALRELSIKEGPRNLLRQVAGLELVEMNHTETCCGFGGTFAVKYESISVGMAEQKVQHAMQTEAEFIVSTDISCLMHLDGYIGKNNLPIQTMHLADVLVQGW